MSYSLKEINYRTATDPKAFVEECDEEYRVKVKTAADKIVDSMKNSPIVLLSGPSASGKTTTAHRLTEELKRRGVSTHYVSLDDYYKNVDPANYPRTPEGELDFESPYCLDLDLLNGHFDQLAKGEPIDVPAFDFTQRGRREEPSKTIRLHEDEICVFEGIHALSDLIAGAHPEAFKLFISARSDVESEGKIVFEHSWFRLLRRTVRDNRYRGTEPERTLSMWPTVRRGEHHYISPFRESADYTFDSSTAYEIPLMHREAERLFREIDSGTERYALLGEVLPSITLFGEISESLVAPDALIREFIGGGIYGD